MTDQGALLQPGAEQIAVPFRPRSAYAGYKAFGGGDDAVLVEPDVARELRSAAELATQERRVTGGLLFGRGWVDDQGAYLIVNGFLEAAPGGGERRWPDDTDTFTLSEADLRLLREAAARMYSARLELGWWRTLAGLGEFGPRDLITQAQLVGPDGVGLLVYGSGIHWGTAYLGPDGHAPDSAGTLVVVPPIAVSEPRPDPELGPEAEVILDAEPALAPEPVFDPGPVMPELVDISAGESMLQEPVPPAGAVPGAAAPRRTRRRAPARVRVPPRARVRAARAASAGSAGPETPADVQFVLGALALTIVAAAIIIGVLAHSATVAVIIAVIGLLAVISVVWVSRH